MVITELSFYKENEKWYADVPQCSKEDNEMVCGADDFLEFLRKEGNNVVRIKFATGTNDMVNAAGIPDMSDMLCLTKLQRIKHEDDGAWYMPEPDTIFHMVDELYLCNVMHTVCGEHPEEIYILNID